MTEKTIRLDNPIFTGRLRVDEAVPVKKEDKPQGVLRKTTTGDIWIDVYQAESQDISAAAVETKPADRVELPPVTVTVPPTFHYRHHEPSKQLVWQRRALTAMAVILFTVGLAVAVHTFLLNKKIEGPQGTAQASPAAAVEEKQDSIYDYQVAPDMPRFLKIDKINVFARVLPVGKDSNHQITAPSSVHDAGWYKASAKPGAPAGASLIDGHVSGKTESGIFKQLHSITVGDEISVERGDGTVLQYEVTGKKEYDANSVDMRAALTSSDPSKPGLNLITCSGQVQGDKYSKRLIVFAVQK
jgi:sortase (surface protein transpeptidase)